MPKLSQSGSIVIISLLILLSYYILDEEDLVSITDVAKYSCMKNQYGGPRLCISCFTRTQFQVAKESSIYVKDNNGFKIVAMQDQGLLTCQEILQFVSYQLPMFKTDDIKFEELGPIKQLISLLNIEVVKQPITKYQASSSQSTLAMLQISKHENPSTTLVTYSSKQSQTFATYFGIVLSQCSFGLIMIIIIINYFNQQQFQYAYLVTLCIDFIVLSDVVIFKNYNFMPYAISLTFGFYFTKALVSRIVALIVVFGSLAVELYLPGVDSEAVVVVLVVYVVFWLNGRLEKVGFLGIFCIGAMLICQGFRGHHHLLSLPIRMVIQYTILTISPPMMQIVNNLPPSQKYQKIPATSASSQEQGISLSGFEDSHHDHDHDQDHDQEQH